MPRGLGSNTRIAGAREAAYGTPPASGYVLLPIVSHSLGEERPLIDSDLLGLGREPQDPIYDVATNTGDVVVPVDVRALGHWLRLLFGAPTTTASGRAQATLTFTAVPVAGATVTVNGTVFTAVAAAPTAAQFLIGVDAAATATNLATQLTASAAAGVALADYTASGATITVRMKVGNAGVGGNGFSLAASGNANLTIGSANAAIAGRIAFTTNPANTNTLTVNGTVFTFRAAVSNPAIDILIGGSTAATLANAAAVLNASQDAAVLRCWYVVCGNDLVAIARPGILAAQVTLATTAAGTTVTAAAAATLLAGGTNAHVFQSGALALPSLALEIGQPDVPSFSMHYGLRGNQIRIAMQRSGLLNATIGIIAKGEQSPTPATQIAAPAVSPGVVTRFAQATGSISRNGVALGSVVSAEVAFSNNLDPVETIQADGRIEDADPGMVMATLQATVRFADDVLMNDATSQVPVAVTAGWQNGPFSLTVSMPRVFLPRAKRPVSGPQGIQAQYNCQASGALANSTTITLVSDVPSYV